MWQTPELFLLILCLLLCRCRIWSRQQNHQSLALGFVSDIYTVADKHRRWSSSAAASKNAVWLNRHRAAHCHAKPFISSSPPLFDCRCHILRRPDCGHRCQTRWTRNRRLWRREEGGRDAPASLDEVHDGDSRAPSASAGFHCNSIFSCVYCCWSRGCFQILTFDYWHRAVYLFSFR